MNLKKLHSLENFESIEKDSLTLICLVINDAE